MKKQKEKELIKAVLREIELTFNENIDGDYILTGNEWFELEEKIMKRFVLEEKKHE